MPLVKCGSSPFSIVYGLQHYIGHDELLLSNLFRPSHNYNYNNFTLGAVFFGAASGKKRIFGSSATRSNIWSSTSTKRPLPTSALFKLTSDTPPIQGIEIPQENPEIQVLEVDGQTSLRQESLHKSPNFSN